MQLKLTTGDVTEKWIGRADSMWNPVDLEEWHKIHCHILPGRPRALGEAWTWEVDERTVRDIIDGLKYRRGEHMRAYFAAPRRAGELHDANEAYYAMEDLRSQLSACSEPALQ